MVDDEDGTFLVPPERQECAVSQVRHVPGGVLIEAVDPPQGVDYNQGRLEVLSRCQERCGLRRVFKLEAAAGPNEPNALQSCLGIDLQGQAQLASPDDDLSRILGLKEQDAVL